MFDPLLYKRHPRRFREQIEVKQMFGVTVHRAQHYVALADACALLLAAAGFLSGSLAAVGAEWLGSCCSAECCFDSNTRGADF